MSSAFKNFFITFSVSLIVFTILVLQLKDPMLNLVLGIGKKDPAEVSNQSAVDNSGENVSGTVSEIPVINNNYNENGLIFTAVLVCVDDNDRVVNCVFIDANGKTNRYINCVIPVSTKITNEIGNPVPIDVSFGSMSPDAICESVTALTGIQTDYCLRFRKNDLSTIAAMIPGASISLSSPVTIPLPGSENQNGDWLPPSDESNGQVGTEPDQPQPPVESTFTIENVDGKVLLNDKIHDKTKLQWLLESEKDAIGGNKNRYYSMIAKALYQQFFEQKSTTKSDSVLAKLISISETNLTSAAASKYLDTIFSRNTFVYRNYTYPSSWQAGVATLRDYDGRFNR